MTRLSTKTFVVVRARFNQPYAHGHGHWGYLQLNCDIFSHNISAWCDRKRDRFHAIKRFFSNGPLYKLSATQNYLPAGRTELFIFFYVAPCPLSKLFSLFYPIFEWEWTSPNAPFSRPAFQDLLLYLKLHTLESVNGGRFCSWSSPSSLNIFWQCLFFIL